jgi:tripartite ATP-independent transporter DctP family solute receptor
MTTLKTPHFHYRLGLNQPLGTPTQLRTAEMAESINREADGEFGLDTFPEARLGLDPQMLADMRAGRLEFYMSGALFGGLAPTSALAMLPFAFKDSAAVFAALDGALGDRIRGELAAHGIYAFPRSWQNGFHHLTTSVKPIREAADLAGLKIRTPGGDIAADFFRALGAEPGMIPFNRMYEALRAHTFDGQSDPLQVVLALQLYEVQSWLSLTAHWWSGFTLLGNAAAWAALPERIREIVGRHAEAAALAQRADVERVNAAGAEQLARHGMAVNEADTASFRKKLGPFYAQWRERAGAEAWRLLEAHTGEILA